MKKKIALFCLVLFGHMGTAFISLRAVSGYWAGILGGMQNASVESLQQEFVQALQGKAGERLGYNEDAFRGREWESLSREELSEIIVKLRTFCQRNELINSPLLRLYQAVDQLCQENDEFAEICRQAGLSLE